jgi:hypothetical protein
MKPDAEKLLNSVKERQLIVDSKSSKFPQQQFQGSSKPHKPVVNDDSRVLKKI